MKLGIRIQHKKGSREWWIRILKKILNEKKIKVIEDEGNGCWAGCRKTLLSYDKNDTHLLVLQDDVLPCRNFIPTVKKILTLIPNSPITFFSINQSIETALVKSIHWVKLRTWFMSQSYVMPVEIIRKMVSWIDEYVKDDPKILDDERMAMYFFYHGIYVYATAPSLVEHLGWNSTTLSEKDYSILDRKDLRMARVFIGIDKDPLLIDWYSGLENPIIDNEGCNSMFCQNFKKHINMLHNYKEEIWEEITEKI